MTALSLPLSLIRFIQFEGSALFGISVGGKNLEE